MACGISSLPVPVSPWINTVASVGATTRTMPSTRRRAALLPTMRGNPMPQSSLLSSPTLAEVASSISNRSVPTTGPILTRLTSDSGLTTDPALSPDGKLLAYASDRLGNGGLDIWVRQISGGAPVQITHDNLNNREPSFSPDGSMIVFSSERAKGGIFVVPALGGESRQIADQGRRPRFSPDCQQVLYWSGYDIESGPRDS